MSPRQLTPEDTWHHREPWMLNAGRRMLIASGKQRPLLLLDLPQSTSSNTEPSFPSAQNASPPPPRRSLWEHLVRGSTSWKWPQKASARGRGMLSELGDTVECHRRQSGCYFKCSGKPQGQIWMWTSILKEKSGSHSGAAQGTRVEAAFPTWEEKVAPHGNVGAELGGDWESKERWVGRCPRDGTS